MSALNAKTVRLYHWRTSLQNADDEWAQRYDQIGQIMKQYFMNPPPIDDAAIAHKARLLAALLKVLVPLIPVFFGAYRIYLRISANQPSDQIFLVVVFVWLSLLMAYILNQRGNYIWAAQLTVALFTLGALATIPFIGAEDPLQFSYASIGVILGGLLLSQRATSATLLVTLGGLGLSQFVSPGISGADILTASILVTIVGLISIVGAYLQDQFIRQIQQQADDLAARAEELRRNTENFNNIVHRSSIGIVVLNKDSKVLFVNPMTEHLFGKSGEELLGQEFGFPPVNGKNAELDIIRETGEKGIAEMRTVDTEWQGKPATLAMLRDVTETKRLEEELHSLSLTDELTGLNNRRGFMTLAEQQWKLAYRTQKTMTLLMIDLDGLKQINDTYGHLAGDQALIDTSRILEHSFRVSDIIARLGGDEFAVFAVETERESPHTLIQRIGSNVKKHNHRAERPYELSLSCGSVMTDSTTTFSMETLMAAADEALYAEKRRKKPGS